MNLPTEVRAGEAARSRPAAMESPAVAAPGPTFSAVQGAAIDGASPPMLGTRDFSLFYGAHQALNRVNLEVARNSVTAIIGPSGCGKSTLLRAFNRMNDLIPGVRTEGEIRLNGRPVGDTDVVELRRRVGIRRHGPGCTIGNAMQCRRSANELQDLRADPVHIDGERDTTEAYKGQA